MGSAARASRALQRALAGAILRLGGAERSDHQRTPVPAPRSRRAGRVERARQGQSSAPPPVPSST